MPAYQTILRKQTVDENGPGTVLRDFEILLDFIGPEGTRVSGKRNLLPAQSLVPLNAQLTRPIEIDLKRHQQKSYPYINALYLLVRTTGLAYVEGSGTKSLLILEETVLDSWKGLNLTERYFTLLEGWLIWSSSEIIGERPGFGDAPIISWSEFFRCIPDGGLAIAGDKNTEGWIRYIPGLYTIALLDLFGFLNVQHAKPEQGGGWRIARVERSDFGNALLKLLLKPLWDPKYLYWKYEDEGDMAFGELQPALQPFFPEWRKNLTIPEPEFQDGLYVFKVSLGRAWRRIAIAGKMDLESLAYAILHAFEFDSDHLYCFTYKNRFGISVNVNHPFMDDSPWTDEVLIGDLELKPGVTMTFLYDFGDNWEFNVQLERIDPVDPKLRRPRILDRQGKAPEQYSYWEE